MPIIVTKDGKDAQKISESRFEYEDELQNFIQNNPDSVPLYEIDKDIRLFILAREVSTQTGYIDAIGTDANGEVYIIETKLYKNPDKRLVVAQVLDYGASISENTSNEVEFMQTIEAKVQSHFDMSLQEKISEFYEISPDESLGIIDRFRDNLIDGKFRFVVLMDHLEKRLKDLITFLNRTCTFDIFGVELVYYKYDQFEITIPKLFGSEIKKDIYTKPTTSKRRTWNENSFFEELSQTLSRDENEKVKELYDFFLKQADAINWGTGILKGSFNPVVSKLCPRSILSVYTDGTLQLNYAWFDKSDRQQKLRTKYRELFAEIFELPPDSEASKYPTFPIDDWVDHLDVIQNAIITLKEFKTI